MHHSPSTNRFCPSPPTHVTSLAGDTDSQRVGVDIHRTEGAQWGSGTTPGQRSLPKGITLQEGMEGVGAGEVVCEGHITGVRSQGGDALYPKDKGKPWRVLSTRQSVLGSFKDRYPGGRQCETLPSFLLVLTTTPASTAIRRLTPIKHVPVAYKLPSVPVRHSRLPAASPCKPRS